MKYSNLFCCITIEEFYVIQAHNGCDQVGVKGLGVGWAKVAQLEKDLSEASRQKGLWDPSMLQAQ